MPEYKGNFKSVVNMGDLMGSDGKLPKEIHVLPKGSFETRPYGTMVIDDGIMTQMVANFDKKVRKAVPVDVDHDGGKAAGWIQKLVMKEDGLWAEVEWNKYGKDLLKEKIYKLFSPEWSFDYVDPQHSTHHGAVLIAGSLTNRPLFKNLEAIVASETDSKDLTKESKVAIILIADDNSNSKKESKDTMPTLKDILSKKPADRTAEDKKFLKAEAEKMNDEQKAQIKKEADEAAEAKKKADDKAAEDKIAADKLAEEKKAEEEAEATKKANEGKEVTMTANEAADLRKAKEELDTMRAKEAVEKTVAPLMANEEGGKILPKAKKATVDFLMTCSEEQKEAFVTLMASMPDIKVVGQKSDSEGEADLSAEDQLEEQAQELMKADDKLNHFDALKEVNLDPKNKDLIASIN